MSCTKKSRLFPQLLAVASATLTLIIIAIGFAALALFILWPLALYGFTLVGVTAGLVWAGALAWLALILTAAGIRSQGRIILDSVDWE